MLADTFRMMLLKFQLEDVAFHNEVCSCPGVMMAIRDGIPRYNFERMLPLQYPTETDVAAPPQELPEPLVPVVHHFNTQVRNFNVVA